MTCRVICYKIKTLRIRSLPRFVRLSIIYICASLLNLMDFFYSCLMFMYLGLSTLSLTSFTWTSPKRKKNASGTATTIPGGVGDTTPPSGGAGGMVSSPPLCIPNPTPQYSPLATLRRNRRRYAKVTEILNC